jgi:hypothetical protein
MSVEMTTTIAKQLKIKDFPFVINDKDGNEIYYEASNGFWSKRERNAHGNAIRYEDSNGTVIDYRPKQVEVTLQQIADKMGIKVEQLRIKD